MRFLLIAAMLLICSGAAYSQQAHPTADQVTVQLLETEARNYRATIAQLAIQVNDLTAQVADLKAKCGKACKAEPAK